MVPGDRERALVALEGLLGRDPAAGIPALPALREVLRVRAAPARARGAGRRRRGPGGEGRAAGGGPAAPPAGPPAPVLAPRGGGALAAWWRRTDPTEETDDRVLAAVVEAAADRGGDVAFARRLVGAVRDPREKPGRRALLLEALGLVPGPASGLVLTVPRPDADWVEESCRALGLMRRAGKDSVPPLIALLGHADAAVRAHAWEGLVKVTCQDLPPLLETWAAWWKDHGGEPLPSAPPPVPDEKRYARPEPAHLPRYYGVPIRGRGEECRVVFCLDVSASMAKVGLERAGTALADAIRACTTRYAFDVIAFNDGVYPWSVRPVRAHPLQKARAMAWLAALESKSQTNIYDAVEAAFGEAGIGPHPSPEPVRLDAVYLLSDGAPNRGRYHLPSQVVKGIAELSAGKVPVHTFGAGESVFQLLRDIAAATGGVFVDAIE